MKKFFLVFVSIITMFMCCNIALARSGETVKYEAKEITDINSLLERAKLGINDVSLDLLPNKNVEAKLENGKGKSLPVKVFQTSQLLKKIEKKDGTDEELIAVTTIAEVNKDAFITSLLRDDDEEWDGGLGCRAYSTNYYYKNSDTPTRYKLYKVTGGWEVTDPTYTLTNRSVDYGCVGFLPGDVFREQKGSISNPGMTFSKYTGFTYYVTNWLIGCTSRTNIVRGGSTWSLTLSNQLGV